MEHTYRQQRLCPLLALRRDKLHKTQSKLRHRTAAASILTRLFCPGPFHAIVCVWRAMRDQSRLDTGEVEIHVQKIRFQPECGELGMARLYFDRITSRFLEESRAASGRSKEGWWQQ